MVEVGKIGDKTLVLDGRYISIFREGKLVWRRAYMGYYLPDGYLYWYRRRVRITELSGNTLTDYQVKIEIGAGDPIWKHARSAGEDIRFCYYPEENMIPHWIEKFDPDAEEAIIWVKVPEIPANSEVEIFMYYGNPTVASRSDGFAVFDFFDDFDSYTDGDLNGQGGWTVVSGSGTHTIQGAITHQGAKAVEGPANDKADMHSVPSKTLGAIIIWMRQSATDRFGYVYLRETSAWGDPWLCVGMGNDGHFKYWTSGGSWSNLPTDTTYNANQWYKIEIVFDCINHKYVSIRINDVEKGSNLDSQSVPSVGYVGLRTYTGNSVYFDTVIYRKYTEPEPSVTVGAEE